MPAYRPACGDTYPHFTFSTNMKTKRQQTEASETLGLTREQIEKVRSNPPANMTKTEAAAYLRISLRHLENEIRACRIQALRIGRRVILRKADIDRRLELLALAA